jgi:hypothetical protein
LVADLERWLREQRAKLSCGNDLAKAMDYLLKRWSAFTRFLDDGRICLSNNAAERALRGIALGRKSWLFAGSDAADSDCSDVQPDRHRENERCRPASLAGRYPGPDRTGSTNSCRELAPAFGTSQSGGLILAAIAAVFTIDCVANMLGEDKDWLHELSISMLPEDGCLHVYGVGDDGVTAFTEYSIECLQQIIADQRAAGNAPPQVKSSK